MNKTTNTQQETQGKTKNQYINKDTTEEHNTELLRRKAGALSVLSYSPNFPVQQSF